MQVVPRMEDDRADDTRDTLLLVSGAALVILGAGLMLSTPAVRKLLGQIRLGDLLQNAAPELERFLKLKVL